MAGFFIPGRRVAKDPEARALTQGRARFRWLIWVWISLWLCLGLWPGSSLVVGLSAGGALGRQYFFASSAMPAAGFRAHYGEMDLLVRLHQEVVIDLGVGHDFPVCEDRQADFTVVAEARQALPETHCLADLSRQAAQYWFDATLFCKAIGSEITVRSGNWIPLSRRGYG
jgi:hypothetical protein